MPSDLAVLLGNTSYFHWAKAGEYITQLTGLGLLGIEDLNSSDDPRSEKPH